MATVVRTWRSAPRPAGASMLVTLAGEAVGSVSGGCVEGALYDLGQEVLATGDPVFETYGVSDDDAFSVGLTCGGILEVFIERVDADADIEDPIGQGQPAYDRVADRLDRVIPARLREMLAPSPG